MKSSKTSFFKKVPDEIRKKKAILVRVTDDDLKTITDAAAIRQISVSEFMRAAALGRRADVRYDVEIVLVLSDVVRAIREVHKSMRELKIAPPVEVWTLIFDEAMAAMIRIGK